MNSGWLLWVLVGCSVAAWLGPMPLGLALMFAAGWAIVGYEGLLK